MAKLTRRSFLCMAGSGVLSLGFSSLLSDEKLKRPNILFIVSEDTGPELGCYGDRYARTPSLDKLAQKGVRFENAFVPYSVCSPSRASFLTGLYPHQHGQIGLATHKYRMYREFPSIPSFLKQAGYRTGIIGKLHVNPESAFPFDFHEIKSSNFGKGERDVEEYADSAMKFISASKEPFFLFINYPDTHFPLLRQDHGLPKEPLEGKDVKTLPWVGIDNPRLREFTADYYNSISRLDSGIGMLLDKLEKSGKKDNTLIIYIGDHGPQFSRGKTSVYEAALRIPMIVSRPGHIQEGIAPEELVSTIDILPTILKACGITVPDNLPGLALQPLMGGEKTRWRDYIYAQTNGSAPVFYFQQHSIRGTRFKLIINPLQNRKNPCAVAYKTHLNAFFNAGVLQEEIDNAGQKIQKVYETYLNPPEYELYDLKNDPYEFDNLAYDTDYSVEKERLLRAFKQWQKQTQDPLSDPEKLKKLTKEHDRLKNYNYKKDKQFEWEYPEYFFGN
ncbi:Arylsulfatase [Limihaloglobus sulfuriphilus]|uniref:Arylsulfatase n=1 Tax=Limihaloglobus sulfuriphilus TaxID=1851148 RepID=A0A1Q2MCW0_9BACT|nr:sulfatase [Limihaloglobus sulfuriphilus]AQQ70494.1 Arylsulfatase [Limihaloglobus sulfuriphilus]